MKIRKVTFEDKDIPLKIEILHENAKGDWIVGRYYYADNFILSIELIKDILTQADVEVEVLPDKFIPITLIEN